MSIVDIELYVIKRYNMTKVNRGKDFEQCVKDGFCKLPQTSVIRLLDPQAGFSGVSNICDYIVYHYPHQLCIECKCTYGHTLSINSNDTKRKFGAISNTQWYGLYEQSAIHGVVAGYMIWFIDHDITVFVSAEDLAQFKALGKKSINVNDLGKELNCINIRGTKRRVLFDYDFTDFIERIKKQYE